MNLALFESLIRSDESMGGGNLLEISPALLDRASAKAGEKAFKYMHDSHAFGQTVKAVPDAASTYAVQAARFKQGAAKRRGTLGKTYADVSHEALKGNNKAYAHWEHGRKIRTTANQITSDKKGNQAKAEAAANAAAHEAKPNAEGKFEVKPQTPKWKRNMAIAATGAVALPMLALGTRHLHGMYKNAKAAAATKALQGKVANAAMVGGGALLTATALKSMLGRKKHPKDNYYSSNQ